MEKASEKITMMIGGEKVDYIRKDSVQIKEGESIYKLGAKVFIRTVTYHHIGIISWISDNEIQLKGASWVADSGRFSTALAKGELKEIEMFPNICQINRSAIVDGTPWQHEIPMVTK